MGWPRPNKREVECVVDPAFNPVLKRQGGREAIAEREGIGEQVHVRIGRIVEAQVAEVRCRQVRIGEERNDPSGGQTAELDEGLIDVRVGGDAAGSVRAGIAVDFVANIGAQQAVRGGRAGIEVEAAAGAEADGVLEAVVGST